MARSLSWIVGMVGLTLGGVVGCGTSEKPAPARSDRFDDISQTSGLRFVHDPGPLDPFYFMPQIVGSGGAFLDANDDGRLDILLLSNGGPKGRPNALYLQTPEGTFRDCSAGSGIDFSGYGMGCAVGDVNNDGLVDLAITEYGKLHLLLNQGDGKFAPAADSGVKSLLWGTSACFADVDRDGWLDLVVANYVDYDPTTACKEADGSKDYCHPNVFAGTVAKLFRNVTGLRKENETSKRSVRFEDVTASSGLAAKPGPGLGITCADFNGDGWPDIFIANDGRPNHLWVNQTDGTFKEEAVAFGIAYDGVGRSLANMGIALGDLRGSGMFDLFITHLPEETNTLWRQHPRGVFSDETAKSKLLNAKWRATGFGTAFADFDHDGNLDLAIVNGRVVRHRDAKSTPDHWKKYQEKNQLFLGEGGGRFREVSDESPALCGIPNVARALAVGDVDGDGALDLLVTSIAGPARLLRNIAKDRGNWLSVRAFDPALKRDAYGAEITLEIAGTKRLAWINPGQSYLTSHEARAHFGFGAQTHFESLSVSWPDGTRERFPGGPVNRVVDLRKGGGQIVSSALSKKDS